MERVRVYRICNLGILVLLYECRRLLSGTGLVDIVKRVLDVRRGARAFRGEGLGVPWLEVGICLFSVFRPLSSGSDRVVELRPGGFAEPWVACVPRHIAMAVIVRGIGF